MFFTHYIGGIDIDVPVRCNGSKVYLFSGVHSKHIIYLFFSNLSYLSMLLLYQQAPSDTKFLGFRATARSSPRFCFPTRQRAGCGLTIVSLLNGGPT